MQLREAADALGVHYPTADGWVRDGALSALRDIGAAWAANTASIAQEHRATAIRRAAAHLSLSHMKGESRGYL